MSELITPAELAAILKRAAQKANRGLVEPTREVMGELSVMAKGYIGNYQEGWAPLSEATLYGGTSPEGFHYQGKVELGYAPPDNPLLRTGEMRGSIDSQSEPLGSGAIGVVGSNSPVALWQEMGTSRGIPPRPFLGLAMMHSEPIAAVTFGEYAMKILLGD